MSVVAAVDFLRTKVTNTSGVTRTFSFLPPHGFELADNGEYECQGNIVTRLTSQRARDAFEDAVAAGEITVEYTPSPIILDDTLGTPKQVTVDNGVVGSEDPILPSISA